MIRKFHLFFFSLPFIILLNVCRTIWGYSFVPKQEYRICHIGSVHWSINVVVLLPLAPHDTWSTRGEWAPRIPTRQQVNCAVQSMGWKSSLLRIGLHEWDRIWRCLYKAGTEWFEDRFRLPYLQKLCPVSSCSLSIIRTIIYLTIINYSSCVRQPHSGKMKTGLYDNRHMAVYFW